jgi:hypothetical protein
MLQQILAVFSFPAKQSSDNAMRHDVTIHSAGGNSFSDIIILEQQR